MKDWKTIAFEAVAIIILLAIAAVMILLSGRIHEAVWDSNLPWLLKAILG